jgi:hypothetical protein
VNRLGRFSTIGPLPRRGRNPQGLNRYSYAGNDPIGREDPSGMLDNLVCGPLGDCGGAGPSVGRDFGGDMAAGDPAVDGSGSGPGGNDFFGCDPSDPFRPCSGYCSDLDPECYGCDPGFSVCDCDPIYGCEYWPKVGWAHYLELLAALKPPLATCHCGRQSEKPRANGRCYYNCTCGAGFRLFGSYRSVESYLLGGMVGVRGCREASKNGTVCPPHIASVEINIGGETSYALLRCDTVQ